MKKFCESSREHAIKIINFKKYKKKLLPNSRNFMKIEEKCVKINVLKMLKYYKVEDHCHYTDEYRAGVHGICNLKYSVEIPLIFHNGCNYDYHFIIKEFEEQFNCLGENTEKQITFPLLIEKEVTTIDKNGKEIIKTIISYRLQFNGSTRFMASSSNLVDNLAEGIDKIRSTNCNTCCLEYINAKDDLKEYKYLCCNKNYKKKFDEN